jgi:uncharacterized protein (DUF488 family)
VKPLATIGYEAASVDGFLSILRRAGVELLVEVRAVARSRKPGFAKTALAGNLQRAGIEYLHLRGLGTPADGRAAARVGDHAGMKAIYRQHLDTSEAQAYLHVLIDMVLSGRQVCILCLEAEPEHCHRSEIAGEVASRLSVPIIHLHPDMTSPATP